MATSKPAIDVDAPTTLVDWLGTPAAYAHRPDTVQRIETHISHVFLAGPFVYKLKKPVKYDFLDYRTLASRELACRDEVRLNRRLAPETYLGAVPITATAPDRFAMGGEGEIVDWVVRMRRLPADRMLDAMHRRGELRHDHIDRLAESLVHFYAGAAPVSISPEQYVSRCLAHVQGNFAALLADTHVSRTVVRRVHAFQLRLLHCESNLFQARVESWRIVDGHGDLRPEHVCFTEPIAIFDCIEFNTEFRQLDLADELAFLAAECDAIGAAWVGPRLLQRYQELSGDHPPAVLLDFYRAYRACVRAKVAALRAAQLADSAGENAIHEANLHLMLADRYAEAHERPLVLVVGGLSGTGKTGLARELANLLGAELIRTDVLRREVFGTTAQEAGVDEGIYRREARERVYQEMFRRAARLHADRISVVLDATFSSEAVIRGAQALTTHPRALFLAIECHCRADVARNRIVLRQRLGQDASDANPEVLDQQRKCWVPWPREIRQCPIDTEQPLREQVNQVLLELAKDARHGKDHDPVA